MNKKDFNKLNNKIDLIKEINDITDYQLYVLIAEYVDIFRNSGFTNNFLNTVNGDSIESKSLLDSYKEINLIHEIVTSPDEINYHGREPKEQISYIFDFGYIKKLKITGNKINKCYHNVWPVVFQ